MSINIAVDSVALICTIRAQRRNVRSQSTTAAGGAARLGRLKATLVVCLLCSVLRVFMLAARVAVVDAIRPYERRAILFSLLWFALTSFVPRLFPVVALLFTLRARPPHAESSFYLRRIHGSFACAYRQHEARRSSLPP